MARENTRSWENNILDWLGEIPSSSELQIDGIPSNMPRDQSPLKRQRLGGDDDALEGAQLDDEGIPLSHGSRDTSELPYRLSTPASSRSVITLPTRMSRGSGRRSGSPIKRPQNLQALDKPVVFTALQDNATDQLPADARQLYNRIYEIAVDRDSFLPPCVYEEICAAAGRKIKKSWFADAQDNDDSSHSRSGSLAEIYELQKIVSAARDCLRLGRSEAAWNLEVHGPLLSLALEPHPAVSRELVTTARISPPFLPSMSAKGTSVDGKMVDFALVLELDGEHASDSDKQVFKLIQRTVWSQPGDMESINQTQYLPLQFRPIAVGIETELAASVEDGNVQLGVWTAAWHHRMKFFLDSRPNRFDREECRIITLPMLLIVGHEWKLMFACDRGDRLEILEDMSIGDTKSFIGSCTILAVVREIAGYVGSTFKDWIIDIFNPREIAAA